MLYRGRLNENTATYFSELLEKTDNLKCLSLGGCRRELHTLEDKDAEILANALAKNPVLEELHLDVNKISFEGAELICLALKDNTNLKVLSLDNNFFKHHRWTREQNFAILDRVAALPYLHTVSLNGIIFSPSQYTRDIENEFELEQSLILLKKNVRISRVSLSLDDFEPSDESLEALHLALMKMSHLQELKLSNFPSKTLSRIFTDNVSIRSLRFRGELDENSATILSEIIKKNNNLQVLSLGATYKYEGMSDLDGQTIVSALESNNRILSLDLSYNRLGTKTAKAFGRYLKNNPVLRSLDLSNNQLDYQSIQVIIDSLKNNQSIHTLNLTSNRARFENENLFLKALEKNTHLTCMDILNHPFALDPQAQDRDWGFCSDFHLENKISYEGYLRTVAFERRNLNILTYTYFQKFMLIKFIGSERAFFSLDLLNRILREFFCNNLDEVELKRLARQKFPSLKEFLANKSSLSVDPQQELKVLALKFANDLEISKLIADFTKEINEILDANQDLKREEFEKISDFAEQATKLFSLVLNKREDVQFLKDLEEELKNFKQTLPETNHCRRLCGVFSAIMTLLSAIIETLLLPFSLCLITPLYPVTEFFADNCYRMFHSPLNPPLKIIDDLRESFIFNN